MTALALVSLVDPQEMRLIEAVLVPVYVHSGGTDIIGGHIGYPPAEGREHPRWDDRVPAVGARVAHGPDGTVVNGIEEKTGP